MAIGESFEHARVEFEAAIAEACESDAWLRTHPVEVEWSGGQFSSGRLPEDSDLVERIRATHDIAGRQRPLDVYGAPYGSDLRLLTGLGGIPTLQYGPGASSTPTHRSSMSCSTMSQSRPAHWR